MRIFLVLLFLLAPSLAKAYSHFQFSSETNRCNSCHFAPAGGGLINSWGREEAGDTLSRGGDGSFLHGLVSLPKWLQLGGDIRGAALLNNVGEPDGAEYAVFPMQMDLATRLSAGPIAFIGVVGVHGSARSSGLQSSSFRDENAGKRIVSREHYVLWQPKSTGLYARAGRFFAPYGLRLADHTSYTRRPLGFNLLQETYGLGVGTLQNNFEAHGTVFISDPFLWAPQKTLGAAGLVEWHKTTFGYGLSTRIDLGETDTRVALGTIGKWWWVKSKLLWMSEVDMVWQRFDTSPSASRMQLVGHVGPVWIPTRGLSVSTAYELFDEDLAATAVERHSISSWVSFLPWAHCELLLSSRLQWIGHGEKAQNAMLQFHYYL